MSYHLVPVFVGKQLWTPSKEKCATFNRVKEKCELKSVNVNNVR